jgi:DNA ligase-1
LEDITEQFPDVVGALEDVLTLEDSIVEGECVPVDPDTGELLPFQLISQRRGRKYDLDRMVKEVPVNLVLFDCLYQNGSDLTGSSYLERRAALKKAFPSITEGILPSSQVSLSVMRLVKTQEEGESFFESALEAGCEGIMAKSTDIGSIYQAGSRGWLWIKYKKDYRSEISDTLDLVVVGAFHGTGRRKGTYGALLMAAYDTASDTFVTTCKLGSGFNDEHLEQFPVMLKDQIVQKGGAWSRVRSRIEPDIRLNPKVVLEVLGSEITFSPLHTCSMDRLKPGAGLSVRFPRFTGRFRDDKGPEQATTANEMESMYSAQRRSVSE